MTKGNRKLRRNIQNSFSKVENFISKLLLQIVKIELKVFVATCVFKLIIPTKKFPFSQSWEMLEFKLAILFCCLDERRPFCFFGEILLNAKITCKYNVPF